LYASTHTHTHTHTHMQTMTPYFRNPNDIRRDQGSVLEQACLDKSYVPVYYMNYCRADTHSHMHTHTCTITHALSLSLLLSLSYTHTHKLLRARTHTHIDTHTHTHTHTQHTYIHTGGRVVEHSLSRPYSSTANKRPRRTHSC
jgi:hypothetical protein